MSYVKAAFTESRRLKLGTRKIVMTHGELIHTDICGPFQRSMSGYMYFVQAHFTHVTAQIT